MKVILEAPSQKRRVEFLRAVSRSRRLHRPWGSAPNTARAFNASLKRLALPAHAGFWVVTEGGELAGVININEIVRGSFCSGYLGYYAFMPHNGRGYMTGGLRAVLAAAFGRLRLHRIEANIQPQNEPSRRLVQRLGFRLEGFSPHYLNIRGVWRDHERWAITLEDWRVQKAKTS
ncbi:MAG: GNAT family N-acetyltransferase [Candidatus Acidiferrales bacterium]